MSIASASAYEHGMALVEQGKHAEALGPLMEHLGVNPHDVQAINDTGAILYCLGRMEESASCLERALALQPSSAEVIWNLVEVYLALGRPEKLITMLPQMEALKLLTPDILNRAANAYLDKGDTVGAIEMLLQSLSMAPNQDILRPMVEVIRNKRPKIAIFCGSDGPAFLKDIVEFIKPRFEFRIFEGKTEQELYELMKWSDISWFEWCTEYAVAASKMPKVCKNIIRLHRYEAYEAWPEQVDWTNIDKLILVGNSFARAALLARIPDIEVKTQVVTIPNGVNLEKFRFVNRPRGKNIAFLANIRMVKNPGLLLQCMQKLHYVDAGYRLYCGGVFQDMALEQYVRHMVQTLGLKDVVFFDGWQKDVNSWLADKHYIVSTSIIESQGMGILEGMACGLRPLIHRFPGVEEIFPAEYVFNIAEDFCRHITEQTYEPARYRRFVEETYPLAKQLGTVNGILTTFEAELAEKVHLLV
jgi:glycosyltransferase involved in cell wall biosynthesis